ncbi:MAG: DUF1207 domain-containing protein [Thermoguttaceae bacterium]
MRQFNPIVRRLGCLVLLLALMPADGNGQSCLFPSRPSRPVAPSPIRSSQEWETVWYGEEEPPMLIEPGAPVSPYDSGYPDEVAAPLPQGATWGTATQRGPWHPQWLPDELTFPAYLASGRESRLSGVWSYETGHGWLWDITLGAHVGIFRYGDDDPDLPFGWQIDMEGAAFPRLDLDSQRQMMATDFRFGVPLTMRKGVVETKLAYYHLSSHLGDDYISENPDYSPVNYSHDVLVLAMGLRLIESVRAYAEAGYAFARNGGAQPWEFQFGLDWSRVRPDPCSGSPFLAVNTRLRQESDFGGNFTAQVGWQRRGEGGNLLRLGFQYFNGQSEAYQFYTQHEEHFGFGLWYDF